MSLLGIVHYCSGFPRKFPKSPWTAYVPASSTSTPLAGNSVATEPSAGRDHCVGPSRLRRPAGPSNCRQVQLAIETGIAESVEARTRAYLLLKRHGHELCKRSNPKCTVAPSAVHAAVAISQRRGTPPSFQEPSSCFRGGHCGRRRRCARFCPWAAARPPLRSVSGGRLAHRPLGSGLGQ